MMEAKWTGSHSGIEIAQKGIGSNPMANFLGQILGGKIPVGGPQNLGDQGTDLEPRVPQIKANLQTIHSKLQDLDNQLSSTAVILNQQVCIGSSSSNIPLQIMYDYVHIAVEP